MINLLPPQGKRALNREYLFRAGTIGALLMAGAFAIGSMLLVPTYVLVRSQFVALKVEAHALAERQLKEGNAEALVKEVNALATELNRMPYAQQLSPILSAIDETANAGVVVRHFSVKRTEEGVDPVRSNASNGVDTVYLEGRAVSRDALTSFRSALEQNPLFLRAVIPISDLVRSEGLPFTMQITLAEQTSGEPR